MRLSSLSCLNDDECDVVKVDESLVEDIANMLLEHPPALRQVRGGYVVPMMSKTSYLLYSFESLSSLSSSSSSSRGGGGGGGRRKATAAPVGESHEGGMGEVGREGTAVPIRPYVDREGSHVYDWVCTLA